MSKCQCCGYSGKAHVEYLELLRPMHQRIANQRKEITRLLSIEAAWLAEGMAKAEMQLAEMKLAAERATKETRAGHETSACDCGVPSGVNHFAFCSSQRQPETGGGHV